MNIITLVLAPTRVEMLSLSCGAFVIGPDDDDEAVAESDVGNDLTPFSASVFSCLVFAIVRNKLRTTYAVLSQPGGFNNSGPMYALIPELTFYFHNSSKSLEHKRADLCLTSYHRYM